MESRKTKIISVVAIVALALTVITATYAYFNAQGGSATSTNLNVTTYTTDVFTFAAGDEINLEITQSNFASGKGNAVGSTFASATLTANNKTNTATEHYYLYLNIENNTFTYTSGTTPEIILTITNPNGEEVTSINGLTYGTFNGVSGFDVTTQNGLFSIANNYQITSNSSTTATTQEWTITLTYLNQSYDQSANFGKSMEVNVLLQKEEISLPFHESCNGDTLACHVAKLYTGTQGENNIYYHDGKLENGIDDKSYRYAGASESVNNYVCFGSSETTCPTENLYRIIGVFNGETKLIKSTAATSTLLGTDGDYYLLGTDGDYELDTIYYYWNKHATTNNGKNTWSYSLLNKVNLNTNFITNIGDEWAKKIAMTTWKVGGNTRANIAEVVPAITYQNEIVNPVTTNTMDNTTEYTAKIGLMYVSDYGFAASPSAWTSTMDYYNEPSITSVNWMLIEKYEWTITRESSETYYAFLAGITDGLNGVFGYMVNSLDSYYSLIVRPVFYLESSVTYVSGTGTSSDPIRIN
mgnify:CR=1 FL=1